MIVDDASTGAPRALIVDDEPQILMIMQFALETAGFDVVAASDGAAAWDRFSGGAFDLVILDVMVPVVGGLALAQRIRAVSRVPIMMLTALSEESDRIRGLETGADDYLTKPFSPKELTLRARSLVRRWRGAEAGLVRNGRLCIDTADHRVFFDGRAVELGSTETRFLIALASRLGEPVSYRELMNRVWATRDMSGGRDMIKMTVYRIRQGLGEEGRRYVESVRGVGYLMPRCGTADPAHGPGAGGGVEDGGAPSAPFDPPGGK